MDAGKRTIILRLGKHYNMIIKSWTLKSSCTIELDDDGKYYIVADKGKSRLVNALSCFVPSFQNTILSEIGEPLVPMF